MPTIQQLDPAEAKRFAGLLAGFDTGAADDAEALAKGRALRQMASKRGLRIVDVLEMPNVRRAIDDQMQPVRIGGAELKLAREEAAALRADLIERTRETRKFIELAQEKEEEAAALRAELASVTAQLANAKTPFVQASPAPAPGPGGVHSFGAQSWIFEASAVVVVTMLVIMAVCSGHFLERSEGNELGNGQRISAPVVRKGRAVLPVPKPPSVHRRLRRGGPRAGTR